VRFGGRSSRTPGPDHGTGGQSAAGLLQVGMQTWRLLLEVKGAVAAGACDVRDELEGFFEPDTVWWHR
jgi:hypothetical protein